ncbi:MAG: hypothetical protein QOF72_609 [Blastocatellia bacterium]|nr:hypothetical protein [Blastocatellia bacterium]
MHSGYDSVVSRVINQRGDIGRGVVRAGTILIGDGFTNWSFGLAMRIILCWLHQLQHTRPVMVTRSRGPYSNTTPICFSIRHTTRQST